VTREVIACADDFGQSEVVTTSILMLISQGRLTATSAMVLSPHWADHALRLHPLASRADVGLHLDWTSPFAQAAGHGLALPAIMARAAAGAWKPPAVREVIERQLDAFERHWQAEPDHIDGHQHVHQMNGIRQVLAEVLQRRYPHRRPWVRVSRTPPGLGSVKSAIVNAWGGQALAHTLSRTHWPMAPWLVGMYDFTDSPTGYARRMAHWLAHAPSGCVLMCHPALAPDPTDAIAAARVREHAYLSAPLFTHTLADAGVQLVRGSLTLLPP
jgi:chitin disaccharide deacetylase